MKRLVIATAVLAALVGSSLADGDAKLGEKVYKKYCFACHKAGDKARNLVGPVFNDLFGRTAGTVEGYKYSDAMRAAGENGVVWDEKTLREYLPKPRDFVKSTKMTFVGLKKPEDIENLIAYLRQFSPDYVSPED